MKSNPILQSTLALWVILSIILTGCGSSITPTFPPSPTNTAAPTQPPANSQYQSLPNMGQQITPLAPRGAKFESLNPDLEDNPDWLAGQAVTSVVSPDKKTMLVLTSGYNRVFRTDNKPDAFGTYFNWQDSQEYVFIYDISSGTAVKKQVLRVPNTYFGIVFDPSGTAFYVSGGIGDFPFDSTGALNPAKSGGDNIHVYTLNQAKGTWQQSEELILGHASGIGLNTQPPTGDTTAVNKIVPVRPCAAGVAISSDGQKLVVANYFNDSITIFTGGVGKWSKGTELDLRPGKNDPAKVGVPGGSYPFWVSIKGSGASTTAYVSIMRDREIVVASLGEKPAIITRIPVKGQPNKMTLNKAQSRLYVVEDQSDSVDVIDTSKNAIVDTISVLEPGVILPASLKNYKGSNPNSATLSPDEETLYVTLGNLNAVAVIELDDDDSDQPVTGLIPTGWYPTSTSLSGDGKTMYVLNSKSPTGANPTFYYSYGPATHQNGYGSNAYNPQLIKAGLQTFPLPDKEQLLKLTQQVALNDRFSNTESAKDLATMAAVRAGIKHVIYIIKENRTYDQILGDLPVGNGDPALAEFGKDLTPNSHALAQTFVTLDRKSVV